MLFDVVMRCRKCKACFRLPSEAAKHKCSDAGKMLMAVQSSVSLSDRKVVIMDDPFTCANEMFDKYRTDAAARAIFCQGFLAGMQHEHARRNNVESPGNDDSMLCEECGSEMYLTRICSNNKCSNSPIE